MSDNALSRRLREIREASTAPEPGLVPAPARHDEPERPAPPPRRPLGELLVGKGLVTEDELEAALAQQRLDGRPLGQILVASGALTPQNLARTLTEQCGFDFSASLRVRMATAESNPEPADGPAPESYVLYEDGVPEPLSVSTSFLDAADLAFELIDERQPERLEIVRTRDGEREQLWSYTRESDDSPQSA
jgi:hypothetical protein